MGACCSSEADGSMSILWRTSEPLAPFLVRSSAAMEILRA
jgi:hypothetical protein